ncbi:MAG: AraC family transcriptional regulator [Pseudomonadota bacterium]
MGDLNNIDIGWRSALMFAVCLPMVVVALMLALRRVEQPANRFLAAFLMIVVISQIPQIIGFAGFYTVWPGLTFAPFGVELYAGPLLYFHADRLMMGRALGWRRWLLLPGIVQTAYYTVAFTQLGDYKAKWAYNGAVHEPYVDPVEAVIGLALMLFALIAIFRMMRQYRAYLNSTQSAAVDFEPVWLTRLMIAMVLAGILFAGLELVPLLVGGVSYVDVFPPQVLMTALVAWVGLQALAQTTVPFPKMPDPAEATGAPADASVEGKDWVAEGRALERALTDGGWYLESRLSIKEVASRMATNETYVSRAVNKGLGVTFNRFVNELRVNHAKQLITDGAVSLLNVASSAGFNSKATFNRVFREVANQTPSQFKKSQKP